MSDLVLPIFPEDTAAVAVTTTVWVGVLTVVFFNLRLGWTLSGLVVPGYLVPLLIAKPVAAAVICAEAIATYWLVYLVSERTRLMGNWSSFFGRDRFFALVVMSVLVRAVADGWLLPWAGAWLNETYQLNIDYRSDLHSYGLIVVSLLANYFWKPGLMRGLVPMTMSVALTYLVVRFGLIELTNFNVGSLQYVYEDIATSLLASPKAYVIIITTAFIASWMNLRYGWEFNGILIPALLALLWHDPLKIVISLIEALIVLVITSAVLRLPLWQRTTVEGGRKILLFFTVCFAYRLLLGFIAPLLLPGVRITDLYGFGYLLSTLLAIKAHERTLTLRLARATVQVSMLGAVAGSLIGFVLTLLPGTWLAADITADQQDAEFGMRIEHDLVDVLRTDKVLLYEMRVPESYLVPVHRDTQRFAEGVRWICKYRTSRQPQQLAAARAALHRVNYAVHLVQDRYLYLQEQQPARGWGLYALDLQRPDGLLVEVPAPLDEWGTMEAGLYLFGELRGGALAIAGAGRRTNRDGSSDVLVRPRTIFATFQRIVGPGNTLQVRGYTHGALRARGIGTGSALDAAVESAASSLWIKNSLPPALDLRALKNGVRKFEICWQPEPMSNVLRDATWSGFGELMLSRADRRMLLARLAVSRPGDRSQEIFRRTEGHLYEWLANSKSQVARRGTGQYVVPAAEQLLYLDEEVLQPLIDIAARNQSCSDLTQSDCEELGVATAAATVLGYQVLLFHDTGQQRDYLILVEEAPRKRHWGTFVLRCGLASPYVVEIPRPVYEMNAFEFGLALFRRHEASALLIAGAHPRANIDGSSDVTRPSNRVNMFNLVHQVLMRLMPSRPMLVVHARAIRAPVDADVVIATDDGISQRKALPPLKRHLVDQLEKDGMRLRFVDGSQVIAGYELGNLVQAASLNLAENKQLISLWLSPSLRTKYRHHQQQKLLTAQFESVGIATVWADLFEHLDALRDSPETSQIPADLRADVLAYIENYDIVRLRKLYRRWANYQLTRLVDNDSGQMFLLISARPNNLPLVANITGATGADDRRVVSHGLHRERVREFIQSRATWLELRASR